MMHYLADTVCCCSCCSYTVQLYRRDFPIIHVAVSKMASRLGVYTLQRIAPILSVGWYFEAFRPTSGTLVTLVWWCITFWNILTYSPRKMLISWSRTGKLWSVQDHFVLVCVPVPVSVCACVLFLGVTVCVVHHLITFLPTSVTVCCTHFAFWMHSIPNNTAC